MNRLLLEVLKMSLTASYVILVILLIRLILKKAPRRYSYALWAIVLFRLVCPIAPESQFSLIPKKIETGIDTNLNKKLPVSERTDPSSDIALTTAGNEISHDSIKERKVGLSQRSNTRNTIANYSYLKDTGSKAIFSKTSFMDIMTILWICGIVMMMFYSLFTYIRLKLRISTATIIKNNIYCTDRIKSPFVLGMIKPRIYLPHDIKEYEYEYILMHEQQHISRFDNIIKLIAYTALSIHWFNPLVWLSYSLMSKDMEMSCDESVINHSGKDIRRDYSLSMLRFSAKKSGLANPLAFGEDNLKSRLMNILSYKKPKFRMLCLSVMLIITTGICSLTDPVLAKAGSTAKASMLFTVDKKLIASF